MHGRAKRCVGAVLVALAAACGAPSDAASRHANNSWFAVRTQDPQQDLNAPPQKPTWRPPEPDPKGKDWIMLKSGEWLRGEFKTLRDDVLEFESDELDELQLDWDDVKRLRSPHENTVALTGRRVATGTVLATPDAIVVGTADGEQEFTRDELISIVPGGDEEIKHWTGKISVGLTSQAGNTEQATINNQLMIRRRAAWWRITLNYIGNIGSAAGIRNINNHRATARTDVFLTKKWFLTPVGADFFSDEFTNIALQMTPYTGAGYHLINESKAEWDLTLGAGWRYTRWISVEQGEPDSQSLATVLPGTRLDWDITKSLEISLDYSLEIGIPAAENTNHHLITKLSIDIVGDLDLDITFQWDRIGNPQPEADGTVPKRDDYRTSVGLGWEF